MAWQARLLSALLLAAAATAGPVGAEPWAAPGDLRLRHDLQLLNDAGVMNVPLTGWPLAWGDIHGALTDADAAGMPADVHAAFERVRERIRYELDTGVSSMRLVAGGALEPRVIRSFEDTPRTEGEAAVQFSWLGERFAVNLKAAYAANPDDGDELRPDGTYIGITLGNWMVSAGWQERWWGPGRDGSLILSNNARPTPGVMIQRNNSTPFDTKWLSWMGLWTLQSFMTLLDDERVIDDAWLFGIRGSFRPVRGLEIGISRTAQWCGDGRPCDLGAFWDLLVGNDNRGVNVDPEDEPGNQLGGIDVRWALPKGIPIAIYAQWIGEDSRQGGPQIGDWMRQVGFEHWGTLGSLSHRTHLEVSDTLVRQGGFGFGDKEPNSAYNHNIYQTGYRYNGRLLGHGVDGDGLVYSLGSTLVQSAGHTWNVLLRYMEINRAGAADGRHTLSPTPQDLVDFQITYERYTGFGRFYVGTGFAHLDDAASGENSTDFSAFVRWSSY